MKIEVYKSRNVYKEKSTAGVQGENNKYELEKGITQYENIKAQIILKDLENNVVFKSNVFALKFNEALNAKEDFIGNNKNILDVIELELKEVKSNYKELEERVTDIENKTTESIHRVIIKNTTFLLNLS